jgi:short-subunit dehydrogenase
MPDTKILITGASSGLGAALARAYARPGVSLVLWGRDGARLEAVAAQCRALGAALATDTFDITDIAGMVQCLTRRDGEAPIDLAIFCAGIGGMIAPDQLAQDARAAQVMAEVNFTSPTVGASVLSGLMAARRQGQIVLVGSIAESFALPMSPLYAGSKAGLALFAEALANRMMVHGVAVTLVSPGYIDTPMSQQLNKPRPFLLTAERAAEILRRKIAGRPRRIVIPWQFIWLRALALALPAPLRRFFLNRA